MTILSWIRRRTKTSYADDKAVAGFARVAKDQGLSLDYDRNERLAKLLQDETDPGGNLEEIAKLLGQTPES